MTFSHQSEGRELWWSYTPVVSHFYPDLASNDRSTYLGGSWLHKPSKHWLSTRHRGKAKKNMNPSLHPGHALSVCIFKSAPCLFFQLHDHTLWPSQPHLNLFSLFSVSSSSAASADCFLMVKLSLLAVPSLPFNLTLRLPSLSAALRLSGAFIPLVSDLPGGRRHRYKATLLSASWRPICPPPLQCTHSHLASGGSVSLLALDRCLAGEQY